MIFKNLYERVFNNTKQKMKGYVAVQRKLLIMIYTLWKKNEKYDPKYHLKEKQNKHPEMQSKSSSFCSVA
jgi:acyl-coenzyme A synthetase/AMP-(fatty) acid ligase